jgi:hypothetical protein
MVAEFKSVIDEVVCVYFRFDTNQMEQLFQMMPAMQPKAQMPGIAPKKEAPKSLIEPRKAHNISIQLRGLGLQTDEICEALLEGKNYAIKSLLSLVLWNPGTEESKILIEVRKSSTKLWPCFHLSESLLPSY